MTFDLSMIMHRVKIISKLEEEKYYHFCTATLTFSYM